MNIEVFTIEISEFIKKEKALLNKHNVEFEFLQNKSEEISNILTHGPTLFTIAINLLQNALKFTNSGKVQLQLNCKPNLIEMIVSVAIIFIMALMTYAPYRHFSNKATLNQSVKEVTQSLYEAFPRHSHVPLS